MTRFIGLSLLIMSAAGFASAAVTVLAPEISTSAGIAGLGLLAGAVLILRSRKRK